MKKILTILLILITSICYTQNIVSFDNKYYKTDNSIMFNDYQQTNLLKPLVTTSKKDNNIKTAAVIGYILLNSFVVTSYILDNKVDNPDYWINPHGSNNNYPELDTKRSGTVGMIATTVLSTGLLVTILVSF
jgi:hypothetical protein